MNIKRMYKAILSLSLLGFVSVLLMIVYLLHMDETKDKAADTSIMLINQIENTIAQNKAEEKNLMEALKEDYTIRAQNISYILDSNPGDETDLAELVKIARLARVDEIHLFDETGTIYSGTMPQYYGYSMESGEQIRYFKTMLYNKTKTMCQDMVPNTAEGKMMMYAMCWNEKGTRLTQVGIEPHRLMQELKSNTIYELVQAIPSYRGISVIIADKTSGEILGSTLTNLTGKQLNSIGMDIAPDSADTINMLEGVIDGEKAYYSIHEYEEYYVAVVQQKSNFESDAYYVIKIVGTYILIIIILSALIINALFRRTKKERKNATTDVITGLLNRRGYEMAINTYEKKELPEDFVYVSIDLNGLKTVNDTLGHAAGDELIKAAAMCISEAFGRYGSAFRVGGDEFAAIIRADSRLLEQIKADFEEKTANWRGEFIKGVSASCGYVSVREFPDIALEEMIRLADERMYIAKEKYYTTHPKRR